MRPIRFLRRTVATVAAVLCGALASAAGAQPIVLVDRDDVVIDADAIVQFTGAAIVDDEGDGVVRIEGDGIVVRMIGELRGPGTGRGAGSPEYAGIGIVVTGDDVSLAGGRISGFGVGLHADGANRFAIVGTNFEDGRRARLESSESVEETGDWLRPHENDAGEWAERYGAALRVTDAEAPSVREITVRGWQNGLMLERVTGGTVADCDASFLSGWGLAMWRTSGVLVARNAFDFCVRGYSHGIYNRGQDSAGILMFEQCHDNVIVRNSATHGGDGLFAFSGREALGEVAPRDDADWYRGRGHHGNLIAENDFSYAAAHGLELTFAGSNRITGNTFTGNAICGIWGGYSQGLLIDDNEFESNGDAGYGLERGGVNIEHGRDNSIVGNRFRTNAVGVHLWDDENDPFADLPWGRANQPGTRDTLIARNAFDGDTIGIQLRRTGTTWIGINGYRELGTVRDADEASRGLIGAEADAPAARLAPREPIDVDAIIDELGPGRDPRGARRALGDRSAIVMTPEGPWDHTELILRELPGTDLFDEYQILGPDGVVDPRTLGDRLSVDSDEVRIARRPTSFAVLPVEQGPLLAYTVRLARPGQTDVERSGAVLRTQWTMYVFPWTEDPLADLGRWRAEAMAKAIEIYRFGMSVPFGMGGPSSTGSALGTTVGRAGIDVDRFGMTGRAEIEFRPGRWRIRTVSDDGIRVLMQNEVVIEDWTIHGPRRNDHDFTVLIDEIRSIEIEYFENDGYAVLDVDFEYLGPA